MTLVRDSAVVVRTYRLGEADRILVLVTQGHGKVRAVAKGVRKTASRWGARLDLMSHAELLLWQGRSDLSVVSQAETIDHFKAVREDLDRVSRAMSLLEVADQLAQEEHPDPGLYRMLVGPSFFWKALAHEGSEPVLDACASCGDDHAELVAFDMSLGGALCRSCRRGRAVSPDAFDLVRQILGGSLGRVLSAPPPACAAEVGELATEAMEVHLDRRLRAAHAVAGLTW
jgi:DNA repair protein RecO (recombination protein O)